MPMKEGVYSVDGVLYNMDDATNYTSAGGRDTFGRVNSAHIIEFSPVIELIGEQEAGGHYTRARLTGINVTYEIILEEYSARTMAFFFSKLAPTAYTKNYHGGQGQTTHHWGYDALTTKLAIIDEEADRPALYLPKAVSVGASRIMLTRGQEIYAATKLTVVALFDKTLMSPVFYGDIAGFPALS